MATYFRPSGYLEADATVYPNGDIFIESDTGSVQNGIGIYRRKISDGVQPYLYLPYASLFAYAPGLSGSAASTQALSADWTDIPVAAAIIGAVPVYQKPGTILEAQAPRALIAVSATAATGIAVTLTLPVATGLYHVIHHLDITLYSTAARTGNATPIAVTTTNLPAANSWIFPTAAVIGSVVEKIIAPNSGIRSSVRGVATTIVCPIVVGGIWRLNCFYRTSVV